MPGRRTLRFANLDEVMAEVDRLLRGPHVAVGNWSLGQMCGHLAGAIRASVEGIPFKAPWIVRKTVGKLAKRRVFATGVLPDGVNLPAEFHPRPDLDARAEAEALRATIGQFAAATGPMAAHPIFGPLTHEEWARFHAIHAAHHLGFLVPETSV